MQAQRTVAVAIAATAVTHRLGDQRRLLGLGREPLVELRPLPARKMEIATNFLPSITGAPKIRAMQIIAELEPDTRSVYCGSIGYVGFDGQMDTSISIRTLLCEQQHIYCWAGGGIVADSTCAEEYAETQDKVAMLLTCLESL